VYRDRLLDDMRREKEVNSTDKPTVAGPRPTARIARYKQTSLNDGEDGQALLRTMPQRKQVKVTGKPTVQTHHMTADLCDAETSGHSQAPELTIPREHLSEAAMPGAFPGDNDAARSAWERNPEKRAGWAKSDGVTVTAQQVAPDDGEETKPEKGCCCQ
jgi:hypothetical protein